VFINVIYLRDHQHRGICTKHNEKKKREIPGTAQIYYCTRLGHAEKKKTKKKTFKTLITKNTNKIIFCTECILQSSTLPHIPHFILRHPPKKTQKHRKKIAILAIHFGHSDLVFHIV
ncbi:hypothetical protein IscW_ISCW005132, partial [Ixodes scapularis]